MSEDHPDLKKAIAAISRGDFATSFALVARLAREECAPLAQHFLGWHYHKGIGAGQDDVQAVHWWRKAAEQGVPESQQGLGWAYANGRGVPVDLAQAYRWYARAVRGGDEAAREGLSDTALKLGADRVRAIEAADTYDAS